MSTEQTYPVGTIAIVVHRDNPARWDTAMLDEYGTWRGTQGIWNGRGNAYGPDTVRIRKVLDTPKECAPYREGRLSD